MIVSDVRLFRELLESALDGKDGVAVVAAVGDRAEISDHLRKHTPAIVLLDARMPNSEATVAEIAGCCRETKIVALCVPWCTADVVRHARAGVAGYVFCDGDLKGLLEAVRSAVRQELSLPPGMTADLQRALAAGAHSRVAEPAGSYLTTRELEVVGLLEQGLCNKEIAQRLQVEVPTVKNHVHRILGKLHVRRRWQVTARLVWSAGSSAQRAANVRS